MPLSSITVNEERLKELCCFIDFLTIGQGFYCKDCPAAYPSCIDSQNCANHLYNWIQNQDFD